MTASLENQIQENGYGIFKAFVDASRVEELSQLCADLMQPHETRGINGSKITVYSAKNLVAQTRELDDIFTYPRLLSIYESILSPVDFWGMKLSDTGLKKVVPGQGIRALHRDDDTYPQLSRERPFNARFYDIT